MIKKQLYAAPATEVLELRVEGITCTSPGPDPEKNTPDTGDEWGWS